ncbi:MAG: bactofilin family protein [Alphaproteobacteria bacterium]
MFGWKKTSPDLSAAATNAINTQPPVKTTDSVDLSAPIMPDTSPKKEISGTREPQNSITPSDAPSPLPVQANQVAPTEPQADDAAKSSVNSVSISLDLTAESDVKEKPSESLLLVGSGLPVSSPVALDSSSTTTNTNNLAADADNSIINHTPKGTVMNQKSPMPTFPTRNDAQRPDAARRDVPNAMPASPFAAAMMPNSTATATRAPEASQPNEVRKLIVGREICLSGEINACDFLIVEGTVEARVRDGFRIEIAETGLYRGTVEITEADIGGRFEGEIIVRGRLRVRSTGRIEGKIQYGELEVEAGGHLEGEIRSLQSAGRVAAQPLASETKTVEKSESSKPTETVVAVAAE